MHRRFIGLALALSVGSALAAYSGPKVTISYLHGFTGPDRPVVEKLVSAFNASHPNIVVKAQAQPWGTTWQQLGPLVASGRAPDVVNINEDQITGFVARGAVTPLTPAELKSVGVNASDFYGPLWATASYKGQQYGVPFQSSAMAMYYNKDLMKKMGVTAVPKTQAEFIKAAQMCTTDKSGKHPTDAGFDAKNLDTWGAGMPTPWMGGTLAYSVLRQYGGNLVDAQQNADFNTPQAQQALQFLVDWITKYKFSPANATEQSEITAFRQGKTCFNFNGVWMLDQYKGQQGLDFGVSPLPRFGSQDAAWGGSSHLTLPKQRADYDKNKRAAALEFIGWLTQPAQILTFTATGSLPTKPVVAKDKSFTGTPVSALFSSLDKVYPTSGYPWVAQVRGAWDSAVEAAMLGKKSVQQALADGQNEANKQIEQARASIR